MDGDDTPDWDPQRRDEALEQTSHLARTVGIAAVAGTLVLGVGIAWNDQKRVDQAACRAAKAKQADSGKTGLTPPECDPTPSGSTTHSTSGGS